MSKFYSYKLLDSDLEKRKRYSKLYVNRGDVVAVKIWHDFQNTALNYEETGFLEIGEDHSVPSKSCIYQATKSEVMMIRAKSLIEDYRIRKLKGEITLLDFLVESIEDTNFKYYAYSRIIALFYIDIEVIPSSFRGDVWNICKERINIKDSAIDVTKILNYLNLLSVSVIIGNYSTKEERQVVGDLFSMNYFNILIMFSLFFGRSFSLLSSRYLGFLASIIGRESYEKFFHLMLRAIGDKEQKAKHIVRFCPEENIQNLVEKFNIMERHSQIIKQDHSMDEIYDMIFTQAFVDYYVNDLESTMIDDIDEEMRKKNYSEEFVRKLEAYANQLKTELDNAIKMQSLREAILKCDPTTSRAIFAQLDMALEGNNEVWDKHRSSLKKEVTMRYEADRILLEVASRPRMLIKDSVINNTFADGSCRFESGSTMNGNVEIVQ